MRSVAFALSLGVLGCLEAQSDDSVDPSLVFGDPAAPIEEVEDDPLLGPKVDLFPASVAWLKGFADGERVHYFNIGGPNPSFIAPYYAVIGTDGEQLGDPVIDVIPGDTGYTPWWRRVEVRATSAYTGQRLSSRHSIDVAVQLGLLEDPVPTENVFDAPVVHRATLASVGGGAPDVEPSPVWYRGKRARWFVFPDSVRVPLDRREMPVAPVYVFQRIDEGAPLYEALSGVDITGDGKLDDSNNVFPSNLDDPRYTPLWFAVIVRTSSVYMSIDSGDGRAAIERESDLVLGCAEGTIVDTIDACDFALRTPLVKAIIPVPSLLVNCPIQREEGHL